MGDVVAINFGDKRHELAPLAWAGSRRRFAVSIGVQDAPR